MNTKKILGIIAALMLVAVALVGAGAAEDLDESTTIFYYEKFAGKVNDTTPWLEAGQYVQDGGSGSFEVSATYCPASSHGVSVFSSPANFS